MTDRPSMDFEAADVLADVVCYLTPMIASPRLCNEGAGYLVLASRSQTEKVELRRIEDVMQFVRENYQP